MTAAVAVMSTTTTTPSLPKRHGFSIESLIGTPEPTPSSSPPPATTTASTAAATIPSRPFPIRPLINRDPLREEKHRERERERESEREREKDRERERAREREIREIRDRESRERERETELLRERELVMESMREREREYREMKEMRDREIAREREIRELRDRDNREGRGSNPSLHRSSPRSSSPPSPRAEKSLTPESENRLGGMWTGEDFKHILSNFHSGQLDTNGLYQPLRVCNRTLASMGGLPGTAGPPGPLGVGMPPQFTHLPINPLLYNLPRDLSHQTHPLLAARYPGFVHPRYPMGPPPGLLFHPYRKPKRNRTAFSPSQLLQLEQAFEKNHYVVGQERKTLAAKLQLTETQVKVWFQNRRTKHKRMKAEEDGGSSGSQVEGQEGDSGKGGDGSDLTTYVDHDEEDEPCSDDEEEEELSVTEDC